ncbi:prepilin peptidase [Alkalibaculum sp. M08DMB]|uniref:Prepilin leader peptidase/N-methyltransferase n=1 Tax=Alkalibaculum sporogenes TaxID=2655001 RepID=A0A6A7K7N0_9FIRM|nr:A24 family peptidase [Alkalibaculum sporogenes]MPW25123.1 prepilin peptidase [Alkalibaculum sporogenes]
MFILFMFVLGIVVGSFLNVVIYRVPMKESIVLPPSHCQTCNSRLKPQDLIPIVSWIILKGRCRYCGTSVSYRYAFVEFIVGVLFVFTYIQVGIGSELIRFLLITSLLIPIIFIDIDHFIIPDQLNIFGLILFIILNLVFSFIPWLDAVLGATVGMVPLLVLVLLTRGNGMGLGDVKLMAMLGLFLGWELALLSLFLSFILGGFLGVVLLITKVKGRKEPMPFGPWIAIATLISMHWGDSIIKWYISIIMI